MIPNIGRQYLPQIQLDAHTTILASTSKTTLRQTFHNPLKKPIAEATYAFPLYDGVSVAGFTYSVAGRTVVGEVKERNQARADYEEAKSKGQTAGLLEQNFDAADVFTTSIGNVPAGEKVLVEITYLGELKNDAETDGARFTIPTNIAPRYGIFTAKSDSDLSAVNSGGMKITVDIALQEGCAIRGIQSPSHPIAVIMGRTSAPGADDTFESHLGSATLALGSTELDKDFLLVVSAKDQDTPRALLETHHTISNQRALLTTLIPKFNIPNDNPEIVFVVDRSGSMSGKMHLVIDALKIFLKSLPVGVKFNICSFGSSHSFLFERSKTYDATSLKQAMEHINPVSFQADYGGTEMHRPMEDVVQRRYPDLPLEIMLMTDGEIWNQDALFKIVNEASTKNARCFSLGIGSGASSALVEGVARAGRGFSQWVLDGERIDKRIVRMLKGALSPHIQYKLEVRYAPENPDEDGFEIIESFEKSMKTVVEEDTTGSDSLQKAPAKTKISLFNTKARDEPTNPPVGKYDHLPSIAAPNVLQTPHDLPELYPHSRISVYLLLGPETGGRTPEAVILRGKSSHGDLELKIPVQDVGHGETIHKLAAKKATQELEEGRGWLTALQIASGESLKSQHEGKWDLIVEREAVRLCTTFQIAGKHCSFVAVEKSKSDSSSTTQHTSKALLPPPAYEQRHSSSALGGEGLLFGDGPDMAAMQNLIIQSSTICCESANASTGGLFGAAPSPQPAQRYGKLLGRSAVQKDKKLDTVGVYNVSRSPQGRARPGPKENENTFGGFGSTLMGGFSKVFASRMRSEGVTEYGRMDPPGMSRRKASNDDKMEELECCMDDDECAVVLNAGFGTSPEPAEDFGAKSALEKMQRLISLQSFTGSFTVSQELLTIISHGAQTPFSGSNVKKVVTEGLTARGLGDWVDDLTDDDCATVLAIAWLETIMKDENDVWEMVVEKARSSLESRVDGSDGVGQLVDGVRGAWA